MNKRFLLIFGALGLLSLLFTGCTTTVTTTMRTTQATTVTQTLPAVPTTITVQTGVFSRGFRLRRRRRWHLHFAKRFNHRTQADRHLAYHQRHRHSSRRNLYHGHRAQRHTARDTAFSYCRWFLRVLLQLPSNSRRPCGTHCQPGLVQGLSSARPCNLSSVGYQIRWFLTYPDSCLRRVGFIDLLQLFVNMAWIKIQ